MLSADRSLLIHGVIRQIYTWNFNALNGRKVRSLKECSEINETAKHRCIGLSFETRPDEINEENLKYLRELGCTKIELGVQTLDDEIYKKNNRGHTVAQVREAFDFAKMPVSK